MLKFVRQADAKYRPFELHMARCTAWPPDVEAALGQAYMRYSPPAREPREEEPREDEQGRERDDPWATWT